MSIKLRNKWNIKQGVMEPSLDHLQQWAKIAVGSLMLQETSVSWFFRRILKESLLELQKEDSIYFLFVEPWASPVSRLRSYKKMLRPFEKYLGAENLFEEEALLEDETSVFSAVLTLTASNLDFVQEHLLGGGFVGGIIHDQNRPFTEQEKSALTKEILKKSRFIKTMFSFDLVAVTDTIVNDETTFFRIYHDQDDRFYLEFWGYKARVAALLNKLRHGLSEQWKIGPEVVGN